MKDDDEDKNELELGMTIPKGKNKGISSVQITAEQIIRASHAHTTDDFEIIDSTIDTPEELEEYKSQRRKKFEVLITRQRYNYKSWIKYAEWESRIGEYERARNVFKRALEVDYKNPSLWLRYAEMEIQGKNINHARNVWERAIKLLPNIEQFWFKYCYMEEMLCNYIGAREIFKNWMTWNPSQNAWMAYCKFEERMNEFDLARIVLFNYIENNKNSESYIVVAKYEEKHQNFSSAREIYKSAINDLGKDSLNEDLFISYINFEIKMNQLESAKMLMKFAYENVPKYIGKIKLGLSDSYKDSDIIDKLYENNTSSFVLEYCPKLYDFYSNFEKLYGSFNEVDKIILDKRKKRKIDSLKENPFDYDLWMELIIIEEDILSGIYNISDKSNESSDENILKIENLYEQSISNVPITNSYNEWSKYINLWINYASFEEIDLQNTIKAEKVYSKIMEIAPLKDFNFSNLWINFANFLIRQKNLKKARLTLGKSIGINPTSEIFNFYIELEFKLGNFDRCRTLFEKFVENFSNSSATWIKYAEFEENLDEYERSTKILQLAMLYNLDKPEEIYKKYIMILTNQGAFDEVRKFYEKLIASLSLDKSYNLWLSYIDYEINFKNINKIRDLFQKSILYFKNKKMNYERGELMYAWYNYEKKNTIDYDSQLVSDLTSKLPTKVIRKREIGKNNENIVDKNDINEIKDLNDSDFKETQDNIKYEEYYDYIFKEDDIKKKPLKLLELANNFKNNIK